jgi:hypothetical protein
VDDATFLDRLNALLQAEVDEPLLFWFLSFAGTEGWRGAAIVQGRGFTEAYLRSRDLGICPGGEVRGIPIVETVPPPPPEYRNRLLSKDDLRGLAGGEEPMEWPNE